ncbi:hypothetical protein LCGC14_0380460 [marine sediment metagenome]|uniref:Uncharacterized protein n=1 Tax=marine sediment metagenome TaxID=412755 RepID=A0A0F9T286_9ZZZZ
MNDIEPNVIPEERNPENAPGRPEPGFDYDEDEESNLYFF